MSGHDEPLVLDIESLSEPRSQRRRVEPTKKSGILSHVTSSFTSTHENLFREGDRSGVKGVDICLYYQEERSLS